MIEGTRGGRTFRVVGDGHGRWRECDEGGRRTGPELRRPDVERLEAVSTRGRLEGHPVEVWLRDDGRAVVRGLPLPAWVVEEHGLRGSPRDGWTGTVERGAVTDVHEERRALDTT